MIEFVRYAREHRTEWDSRRADAAGAGRSGRGGAALHRTAQGAVLADRRHIDLGLDAPRDGVAWVLAEPALLDALISKLLDNALRYTPEGGRVTVGVRCEGAQVELLVDDNGPGIPAEAQARVFDRFYRLAEGSEGTGLGLAIVREVARSCGATVALQANPAEAHCLRVSVTFAAQEKPPQA